METTLLLNGTTEKAVQANIISWNPLSNIEPHSDSSIINFILDSSNLVVLSKMEPKIGVPESQPTRVLFGSANNFTRVRDISEFQQYYERPLLVEAWAQTTVEDFDLVDEAHRQRNLGLQKEVIALREKVRVLEDDLRVHIQLLNQIHATAALKTVLPRQEAETSAAPMPTPPVTPIMQQQTLYQHQQLSRRISPPTARANVSTYAHGTQVINATQMKIEGPNAVSNSDSVKYTIVAGEENDNNNCEPIEIQLAEEDGALNLNTSADSTRLEICLSADEQTDQTEENNNACIETESQSVKKEARSRSPQLPPLPAQSGMLVKRRKPNTESEEFQNHGNQYYFNGYGNEPTSTTSTSVICHSNSNSSSNSNEQPTSTSKLQKNRLSSHDNAVVDGKVDSNILPIIQNQIVQHHNDENVMVSIGPNNTRVPYKLYDSINWENPSIATRKLLMAVFDRQTLATHSMTGKPSPAFKGQSKPLKKRLDPQVTEDIVFVVSRRCKVSDKEVRNAITTKCADENKMMKLQMNKMRSLRESNKENCTNI